MNKSALKKFATEARKELLERVELQARKIGITAESIQKATVESSDAVFIDGRQLSDVERRQRNKLIKRIEEIGFDRVMEETAYTWFNRFIALRFMEVNDYLPTKVRVLSSYNTDSAEPDMMKEALSLDLDLDKEYVYELKMANKTDELFKYLIKVHCNDLNRYMPFMFETIEDYKEILFPEGLLGTDSFVRQMTNPDVMAESDWESVEIIGWLYQYYISDEKDRVIQAKIKYKTEEIPFATQLFTPDWIVRYMVQNALGRYWVESHPEHRDLISNWEYYLENPNPEPDFEEKIAPYINKELNVEDIKCFDPAMGSGHILVYMFDVLFEIYSRCGYVEREIPRLIIEKNLYGLDIDDRAYQLASFSLIMKALEYNRRFFKSIEKDSLILNLSSIKETNLCDENLMAYIAEEDSGERFEYVKDLIMRFNNAKTYGSLIDVPDMNLSFLEKRLEEMKENQAKDLFEEEYRRNALDILPSLIKQSEIMKNSYDITVTNPPYMGSGKMNNTLSTFLVDNYNEVKADIFSAFISYCLKKTKHNGHLGFLTPFVWMYLSSYEELRKKIVNEKNISSLIELEYNSFPEATIPVCTFTLRNYNVLLKGEYIRLTDFPGTEVQSIKTLEAINNKVDYRYSNCSNDFALIKEFPISYWVSESALNVFSKARPLSYYAEAKKGMNTSNNEYFLRLWFEVDNNRLGIGYKSSKEAEESRLKWFPYNKGGGYRKWYGSNEWVINYENDGYEVKNFIQSDIRSPHLFFKDSLTWSAIGTTKPFSIRYSDIGAIFDSAGSSVFTDSYENSLYLLGLLQSKVTYYFLKLLNPSINYGAGTISKVPVIIDKEFYQQICLLVRENIIIAKANWDSFENSWNFKKHFSLNYKTNLICDALDLWENEMEEQIEKLRFNEEELNKIFMKIYGLSYEINPKVSKDEVTFIKLSRIKQIKSLISYFVGCMFGRYSLDEEGILYSGGKFDTSKYHNFGVNKENILSILGNSYFEDDIVNKFYEFIFIVFGNENFNENIDYIAQILGRKKGESAKEALRRYFINDFYQDHIDIFSARGRKAPIYWLFTSGKEKAFNCLIYMHRYDETTLSRIRTDYLHEVQIRMDAEKKDLLSIIEGDYTKKEISDAKKALKSLDKKIDELKAYDELLHHMADKKIPIDLDDGVKHNYELFKGLVAKI
ncbi:BREX-1 system adenine-specific DNA-methyltransferase PglX [Kurthia sp. YJT4]|uniref:BREX-1 system adenine-specific DNA-methyltransferase PglX n=1 Tax=Kurthia sp. YJT4 TaxID=3049086 RepID=UPI00254DEE9E|nr:BREX-1 system adenine-specific DNA-methyltransferase PglX [Kurthia sp. YJT4]WIL39933.1 BREX-1 system adenine-specific DNA-methyltransferase PglX [Kurthia sp. YJT4]